jgi:hypothetical protein
LVELMVVVTLVGLLAALSVPTLSKSMQRGRAKDAARDVANALRTARLQSMSRGTAVLVHIQPVRANATPMMAPGGMDLEPFLVEFYEGCAAAPCDVPTNVARSCDQINMPLTLLQAQFRGGLPWAAIHPDMVVAGVSQAPQMGGGTAPVALGINPSFICISPDGRLLQTNSSQLRTQFGACVTDFVLAVSRNPTLIADPVDRAMAGPPPQPAVTCPVAQSADDSVVALRRLNRDLIQMFVVEMSFNGAVEVSQ